MKCSKTKTDFMKKYIMLKDFLISNNFKLYSEDIDLWHEDFQFCVLDDNRFESSIDIYNYFNNKSFKVRVIQKRNLNKKKYYIIHVADDSNYFDWDGYFMEIESNEKKPKRKNKELFITLAIVAIVLLMIPFCFIINKKDVETNSKSTFVYDGIKSPSVKIPINKLPQPKKTMKLYERIVIKLSDNNKQEFVHASFNFDKIRENIIIVTSYESELPIQMDIFQLRNIQSITIFSENLNSERKE